MNFFCWVLFHSRPTKMGYNSKQNSQIRLKSSKNDLGQVGPQNRHGAGSSNIPPQIIHNSNQIDQPIEFNRNIVVVFSNKWTAVLPRWLTMVHSELMWYMYKCTPYHVQCPVLYDLKRHTVDTFVLCPVPSMHTDFFMYNCTLTVHRAYLDGSLLDVRNSLFLPRPLL